MSKVWTIIGIIVLIAIGYFFFQQYKYVIVDNPYANPCAPELKEAEASSEEKFKGKKRTTVINALKKDIIVIDKKLIDIDDFMNSIGGMIESDECKLLILRKHFDLINNELNRYLNNEKRTLIAIFENFWDKYKVSSKELEKSKTDAKNEIDGYLNQLGYYND